MEMHGSGVKNIEWGYCNQTKLCRVGRLVKWQKD